MRFERPLDLGTSPDPLRVGACGGHGLLRYQVTAHRPDRGHAAHHRAPRAA
jgi:hypothetical protein